MDNNKLTFLKLIGNRLFIRQLIRSFLLIRQKPSTVTKHSNSCKTASNWGG